MGGCPVGYLQSVAEELNSGLPRANPTSGRVEMYELNIFVNACIVSLSSGCPGPCQCTNYKGTHSLLSVNCGAKQLKSFTWTLPLVTAEL